MEADRPAIVNSFLSAFFTRRVFCGALVCGLLAWNAHSAEPASSAVDREFVSMLPATGRQYGRRLWPLAEGGAVVMVTRHPSVSGFYYDYYHVAADGRLDPPSRQPVWKDAYYPAWPPNDDFTVAVLRDGSFVTSLPPYRRDARGAIIETFTPPDDLFDASRPISQAALQADGRLLIAQENLLVRLLDDGQLDSSFAARIAPLSAIDSIQLDAAGRIILSGPVGSSSSRIIRLTPAGAPDPTFQTITPAFPHVVAAGTGEIIGTWGYPRYRADGSLDSAWDIRPSTAGASAIAIGRFGDVYVGYSGLGVARFTLGSTGTINTDFSARCDAATTIEAMAELPDGKLLVLGEFTTWEGLTTSNLVRLDPTRPLAPGAPSVAADTIGSVIRAGARVVVRGRAIGVGPLTFTWIALDGGVLPADTHSPQLVFDSFQRENLGRYQLQVTGLGGIGSAFVDLRPNMPPRLANVSSRAAVGSGEDMLIAGIALEVPAEYWREYTLVLRGAGPALAQYGVGRPLPNPQLTFLDAAGAVIDRNDDWVDSLYTRNSTALAGAFPFASGSRDSLLVLNTRGGNYTLMLRDATDASGTGLIEAYDIDMGDPLLSGARQGSMINLSLRGRVGAAGAPLIAGFVITDPAGFDRAMKVLVRVIGPTLADFGVPSPLTNPRLTVFDASGRAIASNDDWAGANNASNTVEATVRAGAFALPAASKDAALVLELPPGAYTVHAASSDATSGIALVEVYRVP